MVSEAINVKWQELDSELEALLTEAQLIKTYQPHFNVDLKDDKSPLYIILTQETYPRIKTARKKQLATVYKDIPARNIFGPFPSGYAARQVIKISRRIFKFCNASESDKKNKKACFYYHLNQCSGACVGDIGPEEYQLVVKQLKLFFQGKKKKLVKELRQEMEGYAHNKAYEQAAVRRDQLQILDNYFSAKRRIDFDPEIPVLKDDIQEHTLQRLSKLLHTAGLVPHDYPINRIEAYDISNTSGTLSTASMVVFERGLPANSEYRMFKIKYTTGPNDPAMLYEAIARRLQHPEWDYPELMVIDGGKGQLKSVLKLTENKIPTVSIVKRPDRLLIPQFKLGEKPEYFSVELESGKPLTNLIQQLRDEAHRFAKSYHSKLRRKHAMLKV